MARKTIKGGTFDSSDPKAAFLQALGTMEEEGHTILRLDAEEQFVPTGSIVLDNVLKLNGIARGGRVVTIHGKEHGGKSTLCYSMVKSYQAHAQAPVVIFDFEGTCTGEYLRNLGVDTSAGAIAVRRPDCVEDAVKMAVTFMKAGVKLFIFDSIPRMKNMVDEKDIYSGQAFKASVGEHARLMQRFFDVIMPYAIKYDCILFMVNQIRARIESTNDAMIAAKYPSITNLPYVLPGGNSVRYVPSLTLEVNVAKAYRAGGFTDDPFVIEPGDNKGDYIVTKIKIRVLKNKITTGGYREFHLWLRTGKGLDDWISVRELARSYGLIKNKGPKYIVGSEDNPIATFNTKDEAIRALVTEPNYEILNKLRVKVVEAIEADDDNYHTEITAADRFIAGDLEEDGMGTTSTPVAFDDDDDGLG